jgi:hypothetical protein
MTCSPPPYGFVNTTHATTPLPSILNSNETGFMLSATWRLKIRDMEIVQFF